MATAEAANASGPWGNSRSTIANSQGGTVRAVPKRQSAFIIERDHSEGTWTITVHVEKLVKVRETDGLRLQKDVKEL